MIADSRQVVVSNSRRADGRSGQFSECICCRENRGGGADIGWRVYGALVEICVAVLPVALEDTDKAKRWLETIPGLPVRGAIHAAVAVNHDIDRIATFDKGFDRIPGIKRVSSSI